MPAPNQKTAPEGSGISIPDDRTEALARSSVGAIRAAAAAWGEIGPRERRNRIRAHLARTAESASIDPGELAARVVSMLPSAEPVPSPATVSVQPAVPQAEPVEHILSLIDQLSEADRRRLVAEMRGRGILPEERPAPAPARPVATRGPLLGDEPFLELLDGLGVVSASERTGGPEELSSQEMADIEARAQRKGLARSELTPDRLATALAHIARAVGEFSEEHHVNARGLPEAIRQFYPNTTRAPIGHVRDFLADVGTCDAAGLRKYLDQYFEPYRQLSERLPRLCDKLTLVAGQFNPKTIEEKSPKGTFGGVAYDKVWDLYKKTYEDQAQKGFGTSKESTRGWLFRQWLV